MKKNQTKDGVFKLEFEDLNKRIDKYVLSGIPIDVLVDSHRLHRRCQDLCTRRHPYGGSL